LDLTQPSPQPTLAYLRAVVRWYSTTTPRYRCSHCLWVRRWVVQTDCRRIRPVAVLATVTTGGDGGWTMTSDTAILCRTVVFCEEGARPESQVSRQICRSEARASSCSGGIYLLSHRTQSI